MNEADKLVRGSLTGGYDFSITVPYQEGKLDGQAQLLTATKEERAKLIGELQKARPQLIGKLL